MQCVGRLRASCWEAGQQPSEGRAEDPFEAASQATAHGGVLQCPAQRPMTELTAHCGECRRGSCLPRLGPSGVWN